MAKKSPTLTFRDIVLGADADTIRQAHEARVKIDALIDERQKAYERIAAIETQVEDVIGEPGVFPFPAPPLPVAGFDPKADFATRAAGPAKKSAARPAGTSSGDEDDEDDSRETEARPTVAPAATTPSTAAAPATAAAAPSALPRTATPTAAPAAASAAPRPVIPPISPQTPPPARKP